MRVLQYLVPGDCCGMTVKDFARNRLALSSRMLTKQKQVTGGILKNGVPCRTIDVLYPGDVLAFCLPEETGNYPAVPLPLAVLWEDEDYLAVDKPPAMPIHPSPGHDCDSLLNAVSFYYQKTEQRCLFRPLYRLDKDTSGIVLIGKHRAAASSAKTEKRYYAVCEGILAGSGTIDLPIGLKEGSRIVRECGHGDSAVTCWRAIKSEEGHTLVSLRLKTGRTHQIRAHLAYLGHPLAGDDLYGGRQDRIGRQALHCGLVKFSCAALNVERTLFSEFPADICRSFPWLPDSKKIEEEELLCQLV